MNDIVNELEKKNLENITNEKKWKRNCPKCNKEQIFSRKDALVRATKRNTLCPNCKGENISKSLMGRVSTMKGKKFTKEHKEKISKALKGIIRSEETCQKMSISKKGKKSSVESRIKRRLRRIAELGCINKYNPCYNKTACEYFKRMELERGWDGFYATKNGEYHIKDLDYWVDYYEPKENVVIEWDERHHYKGGKLREWDIKRQEEIEKYLGCSFYRINELTDTVNVLNSGISN